ncbi:MAG TPA: hypothetical protein VFC19_20110 [Candidatus Limnocylindrales bacterium]|nr:hypothetical protein [Candidatus Limnocylindrales bacterium]
MEGWTFGDLQEEFEQRLDDLLAEHRPDWQPPEPFHGDQQDHAAFDEHEHEFEFA